MSAKARGSHTIRRLWLLFFCTGLSGLLLEQGFERWLSTVVGASRQSGAIVLALYFVGLALGARLFAPLSRKISDGIRLYALLEGVVGVYALVLSYFPEMFLQGSTRLVALIPPDSTGSVAVRIMVGALWILPPTLAMGATFPAVVRALEQRGDAARISSDMSSLYAANLLGAVTAALLAPYLFFAYLGIDGTLQLVVAVQVLIVAAALALAKRPPQGASGQREGKAAPPPTSPAGANARAVVGLAFFSGLTVFAFEVLWIHLIGAAIGMSAFSFSLMLVCVLLGLGLASALVSRIRPDAAALENRTLGVAFVAAGLAVLVSLQLWDKTSDILMLFGRSARDFYAGEVARFLTAATVLLPSAVTLGLIYPLLFRIELFPRHQAALVSSRMTMANALGSMLGALGTGFVLLNTWGAEWTMRGLCILLGLVALWIFIDEARWSSTPRGRKRLLVGPSVLVVLLPALTPSWDYLRMLSGVNVYFAESHVKPEDDIVFLGEDNVSGYTTVSRHIEQVDGQAVPYLTLLTNGKFQGNDGGEVQAQLGIAYVPASYGRGRGRALVIGLGTGATAATIDAAGFAATDIAELSPTIVEAARHFKAVNRDLHALPRVTFYVEDGRTHLARTPPATYDLMSLELSSLWFAGTTNLYSREFYELARDRLTPAGVFQQWVQIHHVGQGELLSVISTLASVFRHVRMHLVGSQGVLVASQSPLVLDPEHAAITAQQVIDGFAHLDNVGRYIDPRMPAATLILDEEDTRRALAFVQQRGLILNTDLNRYLEFWSPRYNLQRRNHMRENLAFLSSFFDEGEYEVRDRRMGYPRGNKPTEKDTVTPP